MSVSPTRFTSGVSSFPPRHIMQTFPSMATNFQIVKTEDYIPFRASSDYVTTLTGTGSTAAAYSWNGGAVLLSNPATTATGIYLSLGTTGSTGAGNAQIVPGQQLWHDVRVDVPAVTNTNATVYVGLFDNVNPTTAIASGNGIYFIKPAGQSAFNFAITKTFNGTTTTTTWTNVGDFAKPSGLYADSSSNPGSLSFNATGTTYTNVTVTTPGSGYVVSPLVVTTGTAGSGAVVYAGLGGAANYASVNNSSGSLYNPFIGASGSGYTAGTLTAEIDPWINLQFWFDGQRLFVGVGGRIVFTVQASGAQTVAMGTTNVVGVTTGTPVTSFAIPASAQITTGQMPVQPQVGSPVNILPLNPLFQTFGFVNTTATATRMYVDETNIASELY